MSVHIVFRIFMIIFDIMFIILELSTSNIYINYVLDIIYFLRFKSKPHFKINEEKTRTPGLFSPKFPSPFISG